MKPAVRIVFAPLFHRSKRARDQGLRTHGQARGRTVWIDPRGKNVARTLLHELIHVQHPSWTEQRVTAEEARRWDRMTWRAKARLFQMLGSAILEGEVIEHP